MKQKKKQSEELTLDFSKIKNLNYEYYVLFAFLVLGFYLRSYHIDYPSIGYHNMKENEYIGSAKFMYYEGDYLHRKLYRMGNLDVPYFEEYPQIPLIQWYSVVMWKLFGMSLWMVRLLMILCSVASIYVVYLIISELTKSKYLAMLSAFFMTILPIGIFYGRNIQPESPALLFLLLGVYFYVKWTENFDKKNGFLFGLSLAFAGLFKYTFLIILIPLFFIFPFFRIKEKDFFKKSIKSVYYIFFGLIPLILWTLVAPLLNKTSALTSDTFSRVSLFRIFSISYWTDFWPSFNNYLGDNFTWWYFWFAVFGIFFLGITMKDKKITYVSFAGLIAALIARISTQGTNLFVMMFFIIFMLVAVLAVLSLKHKKKFHTFIFFYALAIIPYCMILADYVKGHNYYQMPFFPLVAVLSAYFLYFAGNLLLQLSKIKFIQYLPLIIILFSISSVQAHKDAMFNVQFFGLDVAGTYLKENMLPNERYFMYGDSQSVAVCTYSEHLCVGPSNATDMQEKEKKWNMEHVFIDIRLGGLNYLQTKPDMYEYVQKNYHLEAIGVLKTPQGFTPTSFILKKGGSIDFSNFANDTQGMKPVITMTYQLTNGNVEFYLLSK